ncbi:uncharacterized protein LOC108102100 [Drosophila ficusphila]|uniref:uncharacterized protein LOC108102100 n=1 Tax=Drosophila ficusphila TaxID=30025 RepID=UPI0007E6B86C|nr:uncharacterized protein LOC108102100 [Drosophila ficusphila]
MKRLNLFVVIALFSIGFSASRVPSPVHSNLCKRTGGSITCYQDNTWGFDERKRKCYRVRKAQAPCGFFDGEKGCQDFCLHPSGG